MSSSSNAHPTQGQHHQNQQQIQPTPHTQLRRAVYVHVSDLTSAYNIDNTRLDQELKRVKSNRENAVEPKTRVGASVEMETSTAAQKRLQPPRGGYNLCLLVGSVQIVVDKFRVDGSRVRVAEVEVGDETGTVSLRARDDQIDQLKEVSERKGAVVLRNATLELYQGRHIRLAVTKWGKLSAYPDRVASTPAPPSRMNDDRYFSYIDLSAVASEMAVFTQSDYQASRPSDYDNSNTTSTTSNQRHRSGTGNRRSGASRAKAPGQTSMKQQQQPAPYQDNPNARMIRYPGATLHNYGYAPEVDAQPQGMYRYHPARPDRQQEVLMVQQQPRYDIQQRHQPMHPQMHYQPASMDRAAPSLVGRGATPLVIPVSTPSFDGHFVGGAGHQHQRDFATVSAGPYGARPLNTGTGALPLVDSPRMNPQAPTFDPLHRQTGRK